jgi:hypothetical protein
VIIRIMGEGQFRLDAAAVEELNKLDVRLEAAIESDDEAAFGPALQALLDRARAMGAALPADAIETSDLILPRQDATVDEVRQLLSDGGLIPG